LNDHVSSHLSTQLPYRGRFAPSPTGPLHIGSLYTALASYLQAKSQQGEWLLRIDDIDPFRTDRSSIARILHILETLGLHWDGSILFQSERHEDYRAALDRLQADDWIYPCHCSRKELSLRLGDHPEASVYPGTCRHQPLERLGRPHALRMITQGAQISYEDRLQGRVEQDLEKVVGDFIVFRRDRVFAYHLATVLDDHAQGITEVVRGVDLLDSTPRQIFLRERLGLPIPHHAHVPILVNRAGCKLSKQTYAPAVRADHPAKTLFELLELLEQNPPQDLLQANVDEILNWAIEHWEFSRLGSIERIDYERLWDHPDQHHAGQ
jgi:glutamyl-Q tRNA(Asp) synthetase